MKLFRRSVTNLHKEVADVIKQKYGLDTIVSDSRVSEGATERQVFYTSLIKPPTRSETLIMVVMVSSTDRGYQFQVFEHVHQCLLPR